MPVMVEGNGTLFRFTFKGQAEGQAVIHVEDWALAARVLPAAAQPVDLEVIRDTVVGEWNNSIIPLLPDNYQMSEVHVIALGGPLNALGPGPGGTTPLGETILSIQSTGGRAVVGDALPTHDAFSVRKLTSRVGRRFKGGWRLFGVLEGDTDNNQVTAGRRSAVETGINAYYTPIIADYSGVGVEPLYPVVFSVAQALEGGGADEPWPEASAIVAGVICNPYVSTQLSRKQRIKLG